MELGQSVPAHEVIFVNCKEWQRIGVHLDRERLLQESLDQERNHKKAMKDASEAMTREWPNSTEKIRMRKEQERFEHSEKNKGDKMQQYYKLREDQEKIRQEYVEKMEREIFLSTGYPRQLTGALVLAETLYERGKQQEFDDMIKQHYAEEDRKYGEEVKRNAEEERLEKLEEMKEKQKKKMEYGDQLKNQFTKREQEEAEIKKKRTEKEMKDNINAEIEMELLEKMEAKEKEAKRRAILLDRKKNMEEEHERRRVRMNEDREMEEVNQLYGEAMQRLDCMRKQREKEVRDAVLMRREAVVSKVAAIYKVRDEEEDEKIRAAAADKDAMQEQVEGVIRDRVALNAKIKQERIDDRQQYLNRLEEEHRREGELKKWEMLNRYKSDKVMAEYDKKQRLDRRKQIMEYGKELLEQMAEDSEEARKTKEVERLLAQVSFEEEDKKFFEYADEVLDLAKKKSRPTYPIEKVVLQYKTVNGLLTEDEKPKKRCKHQIQNR